MSNHLIVHQFDPSRPIAGGIDGFIRDLARFAPDDVSLSILGVAFGSSEELGRWRTVEIDHRQVRFAPVARLDPGDQRRRVPHAARVIAGALSRWRPNGPMTIHTHRAEIGASFALRYPRTPLVQFIHGDSVGALHHRTETFWALAPALSRRIEELAVRRARRTIVFHEGAAKRLQDISPQVRRGFNWFDPTTFHPRLRNSPSLTIGWAGRLEPPKDPLRAIEVLADLQRRNVDYRAWIAGDGTLMPALRHAIDARGLGARVEVLGYITPAALAARLRATTALLMTSCWEGFPRIAVEALACGTPVVATAVGDLRTMIQHGVNGYLVASDSEPAHSSELLAGKMGRFDAHRVAATVQDLTAPVIVAAIFADLADLQ